MSSARFFICHDLDLHAEEQLETRLLRQLCQRLNEGAGEAVGPQDVAAPVALDCEAWRRRDERARQGVLEDGGGEDRRQRPFEPQQCLPVARRAPPRTALPRRRRPGRRQTRWNPTASN